MTSGYWRQYSWEWHLVTDDNSPGNGSLLLMTIHLLMVPGYWWQYTWEWFLATDDNRPTLRNDSWLLTYNNTESVSWLLVDNTSTDWVSWPLYNTPERDTCTLMDNRTEKDPQRTAWRLIGDTSDKDRRIITGNTVEADHWLPMNNSLEC